jgi:hypothetical protein
MRCDASVNRQPLMQMPSARMRPIVLPVGSRNRSARQKAEHQTSQGACHRFRYRSRNMIVDHAHGSGPEHIAMESWQTVVASLSSVA